MRETGRQVRAGDERLRKVSFKSSEQRLYNHLAIHHRELENVFYDNLSYVGLHEQHCWSHQDGETSHGTLIPFRRFGRNQRPLPPVIKDADMLDSDRDVRGNRQLDRRAFASRDGVRGRNGLR